MSSRSCSSGALVCDGVDGVAEASSSALRERDRNGVDGAVESVHCNAKHRGLVHAHERREIPPDDLVATEQTWHTRHRKVTQLHL